MDKLRSVLAKVQQELKAPKGQYNKFGGYSYRSLEDINAALKPICEKHSAGYMFDDEIVPLECGGEVRWYVKATVTFWAEGCEETASATAYAREAKDRKGMDDAQVTGSASSYARKYAASALFAIDSEADPDALDNRNSGAGKRSGTQTRGKSSNARKTASEDPRRPIGKLASGEQVMKVADMLCEYANLCGKTVGEVEDALKGTKTMREAGYTGEDVSAEQAEKAVALLGSWIDKTKEKQNG